MKKTLEVPKAHCGECNQLRPAFGFVTLSSEDSSPSRSLCPGCYNHGYMQRAGLPDLETSFFEPITRCDSIGKEHTFHFVVHMSTGLGIRAFECVDGCPGGYQFAVMEPPETPVQEAYEELIEKIESGIAVRYLKSSDFPGAGVSQNRLYVNGTAVNGGIEERDDGTPSVVIDGREYSWEEFGEFLSCFTGFDFRLECFDRCEDREITPEPERPNPLWWLPDQERDEPDDLSHH